MLHCSLCLNLMMVPRGCQNVHVVSLMASQHELTALWGEVNVPAHFYGCVCVGGSRFISQVNVSVCRYCQIESFSSLLETLGLDMEGKLQVWIIKLMMAECYLVTLSWIIGTLEQKRNIIIVTAVLFPAMTSLSFYLLIPMPPHSLMS